MLRRSTVVCSFNIPYNTIIVGGGTSGCYLAHKLSMAGQRVALVEEGEDITKKPKWHYEMPCSQIAHRIQKSGYEKRLSLPPQRRYDGEGEVSMEIPTPCVLGGSGVMGSKAWVHGDTTDFEGTGMDFKRDVRPALQKVEGIESPLPFRGKYGRFFVSRPSTISPMYKPFSEALIERKQCFVVDFNNEKGRMRAGMGRPETLVDRRYHLAHSTLRAYLSESLKLKREVGLICNSKAVAIKGRGGNITGLKVTGKDGKPFTLESKRIILAGNAINNAQLLLRSAEFEEQVKALPAIGANFYDRPTVVLQYKSLINDTHQMFDSVVTRAMALLDWQYTGRACAVTSSYDDIVCYWSASPPSTAIDSQPLPDAKITLQPFALNDKGEFNTSLDHGLQLTIELLRPTSRGVVTADSVNPNYFEDPTDRELMQKAVAFAKSLSSTIALKGYLDGQEPVAELIQSSGNFGGTLALGTVVEPYQGRPAREKDAPIETEAEVKTSNAMRNANAFAVKGINGLYVCDASVLPQPALGSPMVATVAMSELMAEAILDSVALQRTGVAVEKEAAEDGAKKNTHPGMVGGQDETPKKYSNKVKVTYY